jgi:hypothetical protein
MPFQIGNTYGPGRFKASLSKAKKMQLVLEMLGKNSAYEAIKAIRKVKDPAKRAELWLKVHQFIEAPQAKIDINKTSENPVVIVYNKPGEQIGKEQVAEIMDSMQSIELSNETASYLHDIENTEIPVPEGYPIPGENDE